MRKYFHRVLAMVLALSLGAVGVPLPAQESARETRHIGSETSAFLFAQQSLAESEVFFWLETYNRPLTAFIARSRHDFARETVAYALDAGHLDDLVRRATAGTPSGVTPGVWAAAMNGYAKTISTRHSALARLTERQRLSVSPMRLWYYTILVAAAEGFTALELDNAVDTFQRVFTTVMDKIRIHEAVHKLLLRDQNGLIESLRATARNLGFPPERIAAGDAEHLLAKWVDNALDIRWLPSGSLSDLSGHDREIAAQLFDTLPMDHEIRHLYEAARERHLDDFQFPELVGSNVLELSQEAAAHCRTYLLHFSRESSASNDLLQVETYLEDGMLEPGTVSEELFALTIHSGTDRVDRPMVRVPRLRPMTHAHRHLLLPPIFGDLLRLAPLPPELANTGVAALYGYRLGPDGTIQGQTPAAWALAFERQGMLWFRMRLPSGRIIEQAGTQTTVRESYMELGSDGTLDMVDSLITPRRTEGRVENASEIMAIVRMLLRRGLTRKTRTGRTGEHAYHHHGLVSGVISLPEQHRKPNDGTPLQVIRLSAQKSRWALVIPEGATDPEEMPWLLVHDDAPNGVLHLYRSDGTQEDLSANLSLPVSEQTFTGEARIRADRGAEFWMHRSSVYRGFLAMLENRFSGRVLTDGRLTVGDRFPLYLPVEGGAAAFVVRREGKVDSTEDVRVSQSFIFNSEDAFLSEPISDSNAAPLRSALEQGLRVGPPLLDRMEQRAVLRFRAPYVNNQEIWLNFTPEQTPDVVLRTFQPRWRPKEKGPGVRPLNILFSVSAILHLLAERETLATGRENQLPLRDRAGRALHLLQAPKWSYWAARSDSVHYVLIEWGDGAPPWIFRDETAEWTGLGQLRGRDPKFDDRMRQATVTQLYPLVDELAGQLRGRGSLSHFVDRQLGSGGA